jgi:hypothetical protein
MRNTSNRIKESSTTTGTGAYQLIPPPSTEFARFRDVHASGARVTYYGVAGNQWEKVEGVLTTGANDTLTRDRCLKSTNGGALISWTPGTRDVFIEPDSGMMPVIGFTGTTTASIADLGCLYRFTGSSAADLNLPALSTVPEGFMIAVRNDGTAILSINPSGAETCDGAALLPVLPGEAFLIVTINSAWVTVGRARGLILLERQSVSAVASVDFTKYLGNTFDSYRLVMAGVRPATNGTDLYIRVSDDGGSTFKSGASDYAYATRWDSEAAGGALVASTVDTKLIVLQALSNAAPNVLNATIDLYHLASIYHKTLRGYGYDNGQGKRFEFGGRYQGGTTAINAIRVLMAGGNISNGEFSLYGLRS